MESREHQVTGERRLDGNAGGLAITNLANQNDVRILTEDRSQRRRECQSGFFVNLHLHDSRNPILDRIFHSYNVHSAMLQQPKRGVERSSFARTGRPRDENQALAHLEQFLHSGAVDRIEAKGFNGA